MRGDRGDMWDYARCQMPDARCQMPDARCQMPDALLPALGPALQKKRVEDLSLIRRNVTAQFVLISLSA